jgi:site-specific recombinase XerD
MSLQECIAAWLDEKKGRTMSAKTERAYTDAIEQFRSMLRSAGYDLDSDPRTVSLAAQGYAGRSATGGQVSPSTFNQRLAILSSFFTYAIKRGVCAHNPIDLVDRRPRQVEHAALPLDSQAVKMRLADIDRNEPEGQRDYALLLVALATGRRRAELAGLRWQDIKVNGSRVVVTWRRCKGAKKMRDELNTRTSAVLLSYLRSVYGPDLAALPGDAPVWVSFSRQNPGGAIGGQTIADICQARLGTSKVHTTRHSFAVAMEDAGAKISDIGARLGHNDLKTTSEYMKRLHSAENAYAGKLEDMYGVE